MKHVALRPVEEASIEWLEPLAALAFDALTAQLDFERFDQTAAKLLERLDAEGRRVDCSFPRPAASPMAPRRTRDLEAFYRAEVSRIPRMDREAERRFCMGVEFLWLRLKKARQAADFPVEDLEIQPGLDNHPCEKCGPGRLRYCYGCAPAKLAPDVREHLRRCTKEFVLARNELIERNLYIVFRLLERYRNVAVAREDLVQEANASLFKAVEGFDIFRGVRFKTYATFWVNQAFLNAIYNQSRVVRVPAYIQKAMKKINDQASTLGIHTHDHEELSKQTGIKVDLVGSALRGNRFTLSLDRPVDDRDGASTMMDLIPSEEGELDFDHIEESRLGAYLAAAMERLNDREQLILRLRFGLAGEREHTLAELGERLSISLERVRQIQKAALSKIRAGVEGPLLCQYA